MRFFNWFRNKAEDVSEEVEMFSYGEQRAIPTKMNQLGNNVVEEQLVGYPWITEFNLDSKPAFRRAAANAELTEVYESAFIVVKLGAPKGLNLSDLSQPGKQADSGEIMRFDEFPTSVQVYRRVYDAWGGGTYNVKARSTWTGSMPECRATRDNS